MTHYRIDPCLGHAGLTAPARGGRPYDFGSHPPARCPFCPGHEADTPPERARVSGEAGWSVRVVPNRYPALGTLEQPRHEVIIETPDHDADWDELSTEELATVLETYRARARVLGTEAEVEHVSVFRNRGRDAGATLHHPHGQVLGLPQLPPAIAREVARPQETCEVCRLLSRGDGVLEEHGDLVTVSPSVPRVDYEMWVVPRNHGPSWWDGDQSMHELAEAARSLLRRRRQLLGDVAANVLWRSFPHETGHLHRRLEFLPRRSRMAGLELGSDVTLTTIDPHQAAELLRGVR